MIALIILARTQLSVQAAAFSGSFPWLKSAIGLLIVRKSAPQDHLEYWHSTT
jgi:hypothetical protein